MNLPLFPESVLPAVRAPTVLNLGGGTDSAGLLVELVRRGEAPDLVIFSDTRAERRHTYLFLDAFEVWLAARGVALTRLVPSGGLHASLEEKCRTNRTLPSIAFGWKTCSQNWKREPIDKFLNHWPRYRSARLAGLKGVRLFGYDVDERHRALKTEDDNWLYRYPLIEWGWGREEAAAAVAAAGLPSPGKSACFFCPSSKKKEILSLRDEEPELLARALEMEDRARPGLTSVKGLGRRFSWRGFLESEDAKAAPVCRLPVLDDDTDDLPCECVD